ncbi:hypothetical protein MLD38_028791 [Melastoma candidum]|uniref:Uncharacterized protein n=1 Tax=Melastoma candidum TaxID=119954 RepID=A0ACB9N1T0_9MYRT|nr:hypothetical protein MLD38_028791 [Melastoma candidum]
MRVDFAWFSANMLDIAPMFEALCLKTFCELYAEVSVTKGQEFYSNLNFYRDGRSINFIHTSINGVTLVCSALDVGNLFDCESIVEMHDFEKNKAFSIIVGHKSSASCWKHRHHHACGRQSHGPSLGGNTFQLSALIFEDMEWSLSRRENSLPYGQVIVGLLQMHDIDPTLAFEQNKWKGKEHAKGPPVSQKGSAPPAVEASASFALPYVLKELQLQVAAQGEEIRVMQRLIMGAIRQLEDLEKFLQESFDA